MIDQIEDNVKESAKEIRTKTVTYISTALGLVAGLAWNDAIKAAIDTLFPFSKDAIAIKFLYAVIVTLAVVILVKYLEKLFNRPTN